MMADAMDGAGIGGGKAAAAGSGGAVAPDDSHGAGGVGLLDKTRLKAATTASGDPDAGATAEILQLGLQFSLRAELGALNKLQNLGVNSI